MYKLYINSNIRIFYQNISRYLYSLFLISYTALIFTLTVLGAFGFLLQANAQSEIVATSSDEHMDNFLISGKINSTIYTVNGNWHALGPYALVVTDGKVTLFDVNMIWYNGTSGHTHQLRNFASEDDDLVLTGKRDLLIGGKMDVGTNDIISWNGVDGEINIKNGRIISISVDDEQTDGHFDDQAVHGTVSVIKPCNITPGPSMQLPTGCF